jgi:hypothetical protein
MKGEINLKGFLVVIFWALFIMASVYAYNHRLIEADMNTPRLVLLVGLLLCNIYGTVQLYRSRLENN